MATHSSTPAWKIPWTEELVGCSPWGRYESDTTERLHFHALEKEMATHSSVLAWRISGTAEPGGLPSTGSHRVGHDWSDLAAAWGHWGSDTTGRLHLYFSLSCTGEGNGNPLQCSCLENLRDGRAWWAAIYGFTQSRTRLKRLHIDSFAHKWTETKYFLLQIICQYWIQLRCKRK